MHLRVVCLVDWHLEVFYYPYYKIKNAGVHELNFIHPNIYYRTIILIEIEVCSRKRPDWHKELCGVYCVSATSQQRNNMFQYGKNMYKIIISKVQERRRRL